LIGYIHLSAHQYYAFYTLQNRKGSELPASGTAKNSDTPVFISSLGHERHNDILDIPFIENEIEEEDDDECVSLEKHVDATSIFSAQSLARLLSGAKTASPFIGYFSNISFHRYIKFHVFRI
jgi:hypothetical protein